ncbi:MAG: hypothetical protein AB8F94_21415 [Saprospiraceae bacterium]
MKIGKFRVLIIFVFVLIISCNKNDDDCINCGTFDAELPLLFVKIMATSGTNLIENGTIDPTNINVEGDFSTASFQFIPANELGDISDFDNSLALSIPNESTFQYTINLDGFESIVLDFTAEFTKIPCDITFFKPIGVNFNTDELELMEIPPQQFLVTIEL